MAIVSNIRRSLSQAFDHALYATRFIVQRLLDKPEHVAGVRIILIRAGRVVLVKHWYLPDVWTLPGGGVKKGETLLDAAKREVREEVGYELNSIEGVVGIYNGRYGHKDSVAVVYSEDFSGSMRLLPDAEVLERSLFDIGDLPHDLSPANRRRIQAFAQGVRDERGGW